MNRDLVSSALEHVDTEPAREFLRAVRTQLLADLADPEDQARRSPQELVVLATAPSRSTFSPRLLRIVLAAAACIAVFVAAALIVNRPNSDLSSNSELNDVDLQEAVALGRQAFVSPSAVGTTSHHADDQISEQAWASAAAAAAAANPACADLPSFGLAPPTTKAAFARQWLPSHAKTVTQSVSVFATAADASRAMGRIAAATYPACDRDVFDRLTPIGTPGTTSITEPWQPPMIPHHGDRQIILGQHTTYSSPTGTHDEYRIVAWIQVGRAIERIDPPYYPSATRPDFFANKVIAASVAAMDTVFGH